ncbi:MAG: GNAT family N-acetyltransferase [Chloroflexi bacterium]|nr:GNAT family N-acetyltransferase [Chloroflexota bacterium]
MTAVEPEIQDIHISALESVPERVLGVRQELNQLWYGPSEVLVARRRAGAAHVVGAIRLAMRERPARPHGLIADLVVDDELQQTGLPERLVEAAEARLKARGAAKIDAVIVDGLGLASFFYRSGYWASRRTAVLGWDLANRKPIERSGEFEVRQVDRPDPEGTARFILNSYQPYFRWWKEPREDQKWLRVELQPEDRLDQFERAQAGIRERVIERVRQAGADAPQTYFLAYKNGELVGLCDVKDVPAGQDTFDWCVLVAREYGGRGLGSTLLKHALDWLAARGRATAEYTSTSGLDDYDPLIYLATVVSGAHIRGEFLDLVKTRL